METNKKLGINEFTEVIFDFLRDEWEDSFIGFYESELKDVIPELFTYYQSSDITIGQIQLILDIFTRAFLGK